MPHHMQWDFFLERLDDEMSGQWLRDGNMVADSFGRSAKKSLEFWRTPNIMPLEQNLST